MRIPHILKKPIRDTQPEYCIWCDTETKAVLDDEGKQHHKLWFGWAVFSRQYEIGKWSEPEWFKFESIEAFYAWVLLRAPLRKTLYIFAHNGAFDLPVLNAFQQFPAHGYTLSNAVCDAPPIILTWRKETSIIKFIDTLNIWRMPLAKVAKGIGMVKYPMPSPNDSAEAWDTYGKNDADIIRVAVITWLAFLKSNDLGPFASTLASQAFKTFKYRFMEHEIFIDCNDKALQIARNAYCGGRTECFAVGTLLGEFFYIDKNSMYPAVMQRYDYPTKLHAVYTKPDDSEIKRWCEKYILIGEVEVNTPTADYPNFTGDKLLFPVGRFNATLAHPELMRAYHRGHIAKWHRVALYERAPLFRKFVDEIYSLRLLARANGNATDDYNLKILANSLYGKFGQRGRRYEECGQTDPNAVWSHTEIDMDSNTIVRYRAFGGLVQAFIDDAEGMESHPAIAACVTSYARCELLDAIEKCGRENVYYTDTDSLIINRIAWERMQDDVDPLRLGAWKLEKTIKQMTIHGPKDYDIDGDAKTKGIRANAVQIALNTYEQDKFVGFRGLLQQGQLQAPVVYKIKKKLKRVYNKGTVGKDGRVTPLRLGGGGKRPTGKR